MTNLTDTNSKTCCGLNNHELAFLIARIGIGINLFFHGLVRLPKLSGFVAGMEKNFSESLLPGFLVTPMAYLIPIAELIIGLMLLLGLKTKLALVSTAALMFLLVTGCCFIENWGPLNSQMFLIAMAAVLISQLHLNRYSLTKE